MVVIYCHSMHHRCNKRSDKNKKTFKKRKKNCGKQ